MRPYEVIIICVVGLWALLFMCIPFTIWLQTRKRNQLTETQKARDTSWGLRIGLLWGAYLSLFVMPVLSFPFLIAWFIMNLMHDDGYYPVPSVKVFPQELFQRTNYVEPPPIIH